MSARDIEPLRAAGRIAAAARQRAVRLSVPGAMLAELCTDLQDEILRQGGGLAFPIQCSLNHVAAHYCPAPEDETRLGEGDLAKWDIGVHVDGHVVDTAVSVCVGQDRAQQRLIDASQAALTAALETLAPRLPVREVSRVIESTLRGLGLSPLRNLCGHGLGRWQVHAPPPVPNILADATGDAFSAGSVVAIETFATDGGSQVVEQGSPEIHRLRTEDADFPDLDEAVMKALREFRGLPFARRQLGYIPSAVVLRTLDALKRRGVLASYRPLVQAQHRPVAQAEHTACILEDRIEVVT